MATIKGGDRMNAALAKILKRAKSASSVSVGFMGGKEKNGTPIPLVAAMNEYGVPSRGQPPRPFFRNMIAEKQDGWPDTLAGALKATDYDAAKALDLLAEQVKSQLQDSIGELKSPPLAPSTIAKKSRGGTSKLGAAIGGPAKPLVDSGTMFQSVTHKVNK